MNYIFFFKSVNEVLASRIQTLNVHVCGQRYQEQNHQVCKDNIFSISEVLVRALNNLYIFHKFNENPYFFRGFKIALFTPEDFWTPHVPLGSEPLGRIVRVEVLDVALQSPLCTGLVITVGAYVLKVTGHVILEIFPGVPCNKNHFMFHFFEISIFLFFIINYKKKIEKNDKI